MSVAYLPRDERKPNPRVLTDICRGMGVAQTLYVGDSLVRDIGMAKEAGAWAVWAEYGTRYDPAAWARLVRITHWTAADVTRAQEAKERYAGVVPGAVLRDSFSEILVHFSFESYSIKTRSLHG